MNDREFPLKPLQGTLSRKFRDRIMNIEEVESMCSENAKRMPSPSSLPRSVLDIEYEGEGTVDTRSYGTCANLGWESNDSDHAQSMRNTSINLVTWKDAISRQKIQSSRQKLRSIDNSRRWITTTS